MYLRKLGLTWKCCISPYTPRIVENLADTVCAGCQRNSEFFRDRYRHGRLHSSFEACTLDHVTVRGCTISRHLQYSHCLSFPILFKLLTACWPQRSQSQHNSYLLCDLQSFVLTICSQLVPFFIVEFMIHLCNTILEIPSIRASVSSSMKRDNHTYFL